MILKRLFITHQKSILLTYCLSLLENLFEVLSPFAIGVAIDGLLKKNYESLTLIICTWLAYLITSVMRQIYDTRTFSIVYSNLATLVVLEQNKQGVPKSQIIARSSLSRGFVDFFERDIPQILRALFGLIGAWVMLFIYDLQIGFYCVTLFVPLFLINRVYIDKTIYLSRKLNDRLEREVEILTECKSEEVFQHYQSLSKWQISLSNAEATNYGLMELFSIVLAIAVLVRTVQLPGIKVGDIYAIISYLLNFLLSLKNVPQLVQQFSRLKDIGDRVKLDIPEISTQLD